MGQKQLFLKSGFLFLFLISSSFFWAQSISANQHSLTYSDFLKKLNKHNLGYATEKYNISIADAEVEAAKIFPDPELSFTAFDNQERRMKMGYGFEVEVEWELELGGKRKARKNLAKDELELAHLELTEYFHELRTESTITFLHVLRNKMHYEIEKKAYERMLELSEMDSIRYQEGKIRKSRANQSKLEALSRYNHFQDVTDELKFSLLDIKNLISEVQHDTLFIPVGDLENFDRVFDLDYLLKSAQENRPDMHIARHNHRIADSKIALKKAERVMDLGLSIGVENNSFAKNIIGPTPGHTVVFAGVSVPLKFSNNKDAGLKTAQYEKQQSELQYRQMSLELEKEIREAYDDYLTKQEQVKTMKAGIESAEFILQEEMEYYLKGESSLLEVLNAEKVFSKLQNDYINRLLSYGEALVELENLTGIWDIDF